MINNLPAMWETWVRSLDWEDPLEQSMATHSIVLAWRNSMDRGAWRATVRRVAKSQTRLSDSAHRSFHSHLEALFSSLSIPRWQPTLVLSPGKSHGWRSLVDYSPWGSEESDTTERLSLSLFTFTHWRRKWQPIPVFLPGESQGRRSLVCCHLWGCTESDTTDVTELIPRN